MYWTFGFYKKKKKKLLLSLHVKLSNNYKYYNNFWNQRSKNNGKLFIIMVEAGLIFIIEILMIIKICYLIFYCMFKNISEL